MLYYLSCLLGLYHFSGGLRKTPVAQLPAKFPGIPQAVLQGLLNRFAEPMGKFYTITDQTKTKLLTWIGTCYLACDGWSVDVGKVAQELKLTPTK
jgi:DNA-directed RNA polymerase I subunit RPA49